MNLDASLVIGFLILTLIVGIGHGQKVKTIKDYALGGRNFSTAALVATIVATAASGSGFFITLSRTYTDGLYDLLAALGIGISFIAISYLAPRMGEFLGKISIAEAMGDLYGKKVRIITAIAGTIGSAGHVAIQFKAFGSVFAYFFHLPSFIAIITTGIITTIYSAFGGIRAVSFTDILQFFTFGIIIPLVGFLVWNQFYNDGFSLAQAVSDPKFNLRFLFDSTNPKLLGMLVMFTLLAIPTLGASTFQRVSMGRNIFQVQKAFLISGILLIFIQLIIAWIPFLIHGMNPFLANDQLLSYIVDTYSYPGLRGFIIIAIIAFTMSTADSRINSAAVLFTNDICTAFTDKLKNGLFIPKLFTCFLGLGAILISLIESDLLSIFILANSFYYPIVTPIFLLTIFGFRSTQKSVLIAMTAGFITTVVWKILPIHFEGVSQKMVGVLLAMFCNAFFLISSHYLLKQKGGWVGIKDQKSLIAYKIKQQNNRRKFIYSISQFSIKNYLKKLAPKNDLTYTMLGIYFIIFTITTMYSTYTGLVRENSRVLYQIQQLMLITSTTMALYPLWPLSISHTIKEAIVRTWWPIAIFYMLIFFSGLFVMTSNFAPLQLLFFTTNIMIAAILLGWRLSLFTIPVGLYSSMRFHHYLFGEHNLDISFGSPEFILLYISLIIVLALLFFLKPKEEYLENTEEKVIDLDSKVTHYSERISGHEQEIERLSATSQKILNKVNHELRLPVGNVNNFSEMLNEALSKSSDKYIQELSKELHQNSTRLSSMILNMLDLATLEVKKVDLKKQTINFSELVENRVAICKKIYLQNKPIVFDYSIEPKVMIAVDANYIRQTIDNLVINAIKFSQQGMIKVSVQKKKGEVIFTIRDQGLGIPKEELLNVFEAFKMGSNTESKAEGRGVGLALCKSVIQAHGGTITAESDGKKGATLKFVLFFSK